MQKTFGLNRFSTDLDFTSTNNRAEKIVREVAKDITTFGFPSEVSGIEKKEIGKTMKLKIKGPIYEGSEKTITVLRAEISLRKDLLLSPVTKEVIPVYSDLRPYYVLVMDLKEILAEKVKAIMWRAHPRDLYDLWFLLRKGLR